MSIDHDAPVVSRKSIVIHAGPERVWAIHTDIESWPAWQADVATAVLDGPLVVGARFRWHTAGLDITSTIADVRAPRRIEWGGPAHGITGVHVWEFEPTADGVRVHTEESWRGAPVDEDPDRLQYALDDALEEWLRRLKDRAERHDDAGERS